MSKVISHKNIPGIVTREATPTDLPFILATWLRGQRYGHPYFKAIDPDAFYAHYKPYILSLLAKPTTKVMVACAAADPDVILAFTVASQNCLYWAYTKRVHRGRGLQRSLLVGPLAFVKTVSGFTEVGEVIRKKKKWTLNPWA